MSYTLKEILYLAILQASAGMDENAKAQVNDVAIAESLLPDIFQTVGQNAAKNEDTRSILRREKTVSFVNGTADLDSDILTQYKDDSTLFDPDDPTTEYSLCQTMTMFAGPKDDREGYYLFNEAFLRVIEPGAQFVSGSGLTGDLKLTIPCVPVIPAGADDVVDAGDEIISDILEMLVDGLKGRVVQDAEAA
jgi:hypothetical protein